MLWRYRIASTTLRGIKNMAAPFVKGQQCGHWCAPRWDKLQPDSKSLAVAPSIGGSYTVEPAGVLTMCLKWWIVEPKHTNISGQAHPVSISIQPGFALLDKADSSPQPRSKASCSHPMFLLQCWSYLRFLRVHSFSCFLGFLWRNVIISYCGLPSWNSLL